MSRTRWRSGRGRRWFAPITMGFCLVLACLVASSNVGVRAEARCPQPGSTATGVAGCSDSLDMDAASLARLLPANRQTLSELRSLRDPLPLADPFRRDRQIQASVTTAETGVAVHVETERALHTVAASVERGSRESGGGMAGASLDLFVLGATALAFSFSLATSIAYLIQNGRAGLVVARRLSVAAEAPVDYEHRCRLLLQNASVLWTSAESTVLRLDDGLPLRTLLLDELKVIARRLAANPTVQSIGQGTMTTGHPDAYWRTLSQGLGRAVRDLQRICAVAEAGRASFGDRSNEPRLPSTTEEAYFVLGANPGVDSDTLQRLVRALRQCWHPDLAQNDVDRRYREARIRQINVANDIVRQSHREVTDPAAA